MKTTWQITQLFCPGKSYVQEQAKLIGNGENENRGFQGGNRLDIDWNWAWGNVLG